MCESEPLLRICSSRSPSTCVELMSACRHTYCQWYIHYNAWHWVVNAKKKMIVNEESISPRVLLCLKNKGKGLGVLPPLDNRRNTKTSLKVQEMQAYQAFCSEVYGESTTSFGPLLGILIYRGVANLHFHTWITWFLYVVNNVVKFTMQKNHNIIFYTTCTHSVILTNYMKKFEVEEIGWKMMNWMKSEGKKLNSI